MSGLHPFLQKLKKNPKETILAELDKLYSQEKHQEEKDSITEQQLVDFLAHIKGDDVNAYKTEADNILHHPILAIDLIFLFLIKKFYTPTLRLTPTDDQLIEISTILTKKLKQFEPSATRIQAYAFHKHADFKSVVFLDHLQISPENAMYLLRCIIASKNIPPKYIRKLLAVPNLNLYEHDTHVYPGAAESKSWAQGGIIRFAMNHEVHSDILKLLLEKARTDSSLDKDIKDVSLPKLLGMVDTEFFLKKAHYIGAQLLLDKDIVGEEQTKRYIQALETRDAAPAEKHPTPAAEIKREEEEEEEEEEEGVKQEKTIPFATYPNTYKFDLSVQSSATTTAQSRLKKTAALLTLPVAQPKPQPGSESLTSQPGAAGQQPQVSDQLTLEERIRSQSLQPGAGSVGLQSGAATINLRP